MWRTLATLLTLLFSILVSIFFFTSPLPTDYYLSIEEKAIKDGFKAWRYNVTTEDGFTLALYRMHKQPGPSVLLLHGFGCSSESFVFNFNGKSVASMLAEAGFDVWLGSNRGNVHSRVHSFMSPDQEEFWDWGSHEMGLMDVPAFISQIQRVTNTTSLAILGHSQGGTIGLSVLEQFPALRSEVKAVVMLASPPGKIPQLPFILRVLTNKSVVKVLHLLGVHKILDAPGTVLVQFCHYFPFLSRFLLPATFDYTLNSDDPELSRLSSVKMAGGTSLQSLQYARQLSQTQTNVPYRFDYGAAINTMIYGSPTPPAINYSVVGVPAAYFAGGHDTLVTPWEMNLMKSLLGDLLEVYETGLNHDHFSLLLSNNMEYMKDVVQFLNKYLTP